MAYEANFAFTGLFDFSFVSRELIIPFSSKYSSAVLDVNFLFYFQPTVNLPDQCPPEFTGVEDFRLYVNFVDVSKALKAALNKRVAAADPAETKSFYLRGVKSYLTTLESLNKYQAETAGEKQKADKYASTANWARAFDKLGDQTFGWRGNLHPINYIYNYIPLQPISVRELMGGDTSSISTLAFSQGTASFIDAFRPTLPAGRLYYQCEVIFENPLSGILTEIRTSLEAMDRKLGLWRTQYLEPATERLARVEKDVSSSAGAMSATVQRLIDTVENIQPCDKSK